MITMKGIKGGEPSALSTFAMSAAAYGRTAHVQILQGSDPCHWSTLAAF